MMPNDGGGNAASAFAVVAFCGVDARLENGDVKPLVGREDELLSGVELELRTADAVRPPPTSMLKAVAAGVDPGVVVGVVGGAGVPVRLAAGKGEEKPPTRGGAAPSPTEERSIGETTSEHERLPPAAHV